MHFYAGTHKKWLRDRTDEAIKKGLAIFISECAGMEATGNGPLDHNEWKLFKDWMDERKLSWIAWSVSDKNETCSVLKPSASSYGNWKEEDIKEWGRLVKNTLLDY
jgi:endoglucanase